MVYLLHVSHETYWNYSPCLMTQAKAWDSLGKVDTSKVMQKNKDRFKSHHTVNRNFPKFKKYSEQIAQMVQLTGFINFSAENRNFQFPHMDGCAPCQKKNVSGSFRVSLFFDSGAHAIWRQSLGTFMISRPI